MKSRKPKQIWIDNILKTYFKSAEIEKAEGLVWYPKARRYAEDLGARYNVPARQVSGVIAALSPATNWDQNLKDTESLLRHGENCKVTTYGPNKKKALSIWKGSEPTKNLGRNKTLSFFECIEGSDVQVYIDRHAAAVALGRRINDKERNQLQGVLYEKIQNAYRIPASVLGLLPSELQAITWVHWRNQK